MAKKKQYVLFRLILIPAALLALLLLVIRLTNRVEKSGRPDRTTEVRSFGIPIPEGYNVLGIDVSKHQDEINWKSVDTMTDHKKEITFVFVKATEGITRQDPAFSRNWKELKKTGLIKGAYHFYYPSRDAKKQALNFIRQVHLEKGDLPPVVDIEHSNGKNRKQITKGLAAFMAVLEDHYRIKPIIYTNHSFYSDYLKGSFDSYPLWISNYNGHESFKKTCTYRWHFWQHSDKGKVAGISGPVDFNVFNGTKDQLLSLCID